MVSWSFCPVVGEGETTFHVGTARGVAKTAENHLDDERPLILLDVPHESLPWVDTLLIHLFEDPVIRVALGQHFAVRGSNPIAVVLFQDGSRREHKHGRGPELKEFTRDLFRVYRLKKGLVRYWPSSPNVTTSRLATPLLPRHIATSEVVVVGRPRGSGIH